MSRLNRNEIERELEVFRDTNLGKGEDEKTEEPLEEIPGIDDEKGEDGFFRVSSLRERREYARRKRGGK